MKRCLLLKDDADGRYSKVRGSWEDGCMVSMHPQLAQIQAAEEAGFVAHFQSILTTSHTLDEVAKWVQGNALDSYDGEEVTACNH